MSNVVQMAAYRGKAVETMSRDELIAALDETATALKRERDAHIRSIEKWATIAAENAPMPTFFDTLFRRRRTAQ
jgi:hypothetical protein